MVATHGRLACRKLMEHLAFTRNREREEANEDKGKAREQSAVHLKWR